MLPAETKASAWPPATRRAATTIDDSGRPRTALAGSSLEVMRSVGGHDLDVGRAGDKGLELRAPTDEHDRKVLAGDRQRPLDRLGRRQVATHRVERHAHVCAGRLRAQGRQQLVRRAQRLQPAASAMVQIADQAIDVDAFVDDAVDEVDLAALADAQTAEEARRPVGSRDRVARDRHERHTRLLGTAQNGGAGHVVAGQHHGHRRRVQSSEDDLGTVAADDDDLVRA